MKRIRTYASLQHPPQEVWAVLTDFNSYADWNPLNISADGRARPDARIPMRFVDAGGGKGKIISQTVTITDCERPRRLAWVGRVPILFKGRHFFELEPEGAGTRLTHGEDLSGLIPVFFSAERLERQKAAYEAMKQALEQRLAALTSR
jgi:hypothetical protein